MALPDLSKYPKLSSEQAGHVRHFYNLVSQPDGEWHRMGCQEPGQEFLDAYRYQLAMMAYATAATHFHHHPALRSVYKSLLRQIIHKMLRREVWGYWFNTSLGGIVTDPSLKELRTPWADPVVKENIMYSGHLLLMTSLYAMLFDEGEFEKEGALTFYWNPMFFGLGAEKFVHNTQKLQDAVLKEMEANGWVGVCCEPNAVFVVCNQFPLIAMRLNDVRHGTNLIPGVLEKYQAAWAKKGMLGEDGLMKDMWLVKQDLTIAAKDPAFTAWGAAFMNSWNSEFVKRTYHDQALGFLTTHGDETKLQPPVVGITVRKLVKEEGADPNSEETLRRAVEIAHPVAAEKLATRSEDQPLQLYTKPILGCISQWLSELGKKTELDGLFRWIDNNLNPTWENGGLYYPRNDQPWDEKTLAWTHMDPFTGNGGLAYSRLNVEDGMKKIWENPWTASTLQSRPYIDNVRLAEGVDFLRGVWDEEAKILVLTMRSWDGGMRKVRPVFKNLTAGKWSVSVDGELKVKADVEVVGEIGVDVEVGESEVDVVVSSC